MATSESKSAAKSLSHRRRQFWVFTGLLGVLTGTSAFLLMVSPTPLRPDGGNAALAADKSGPVAEKLAELKGVFGTRVAVDNNRWGYVFVHHTAGGVANGGDHFVVTADGQVQMTARWDTQVQAGPPVGAKSIDGRCISVAVVGDFDSSVPSEIQLKRTAQLVRTLTAKLKLGPDRVVTLQKNASAMGVGGRFPMVEFAALTRE